MNRMFSCYECIHYLFCKGLPYCGGISFVSRFFECCVCGRIVDRELMESADICKECAALEKAGGAE